LVVPKSIPIIFPIVLYSFLKFYVFVEISHCCGAVCQSLCQ
jgi:hypothetical protein